MLTVMLRTEESQQAFVKCEMSLWEVNDVRHRTGTALRNVYHACELEGKGNATMLFSFLPQYHKFDLQ